MDGQPFPAKLVGIDAKWQVSLQSGEDRRAMPAAELLRWGSCVEAPRGPLLVLADGGLLVADVLRADKEELVADAGMFGLVKLPLELLAGVVFRLPAERHACDLLVDRIASATGDSDLVILTNGDEVAGRVEAIRQDAVRLEAVLGGVDLEIHRIRAIVFNPALLRRVEHPGLCAVAGFSDGSRLIADRLIVRGDSLEVEIADSLRWSGVREHLVLLQPLGGRVVYLSDCKPADYQHLPFLDLSWPYRADRSVTGGFLRSGGQVYLKGLGMHSAARLTYRLDEPFRRFEAELAVDDSAGGRGSVRFRVFIDGSLKHVSPTIRGDMPPVSVSIDLDGAKRLDLVVDFADRADELDRADWLNARLVR